ncbi:MAG: LamG-like jellyroll fold domain-containing protein [Verrucomicrobiota bacterium]
MLNTPILARLSRWLPLFLVAATLVPLPLTAHPNHNHHHETAEPAWQGISLELPEGLPSSFSVAVPFEGRQLTLQLEKNSVFGKNTRILVDDGTGSPREIDLGPDPSYLGQVAERPDFTVSGVLTDDGLVASIIRPYQESISIEPDPEALDSAKHRISVTTSGDHQDPTQEMVAAPAIAPAPSDSDYGTAASSGPITSVISLLGNSGGSSIATLPPSKVMTVLEFEIGVEIGSRAFTASDTYNNNMTTAQNSAASVVTNMDARYLRSAGIKHKLGTVMVRTSTATDPMYNSVTSNSTASLEAFRNYWNSAAGQAEVGTSHDIAVYHVKSAPSGRAWVNSVGGSNRYALSCGNSTWSWADGTVVHEFGHSWNLQHINTPPIAVWDYASGGAVPNQFYESKPRNNSGSNSAGGNHVHITPMDGRGEHNIGRLASDEATTVMNARNNKSNYGDPYPNPNPTAPFGFRDSATSVGGDPITIDVIANDYDINNDVLDLQLLDTVSQRGGTISLSAGTGPGGRNELIYTPPANPSGNNDFFHYTVCDSTGRSDWGYVLVTLIPDLSPKEVDPASYIADSVNDWVPATQGANGWQYGIGSSSSFTLLNVPGTETADVGGDKSSWRYSGGGFSIIAQYAMHPHSETSASIKRWTSDYAGPVAIHLSSERMTNAGNGQVVAISHNGTQIFSQTLNSGFPQDVSTVEAILEVGDTVDLVLGSNNGVPNDWTAVHMKIVQADQYRSDPSLILHYPLNESYLHPAVIRETAADHSGSNQHADLIGGDDTTAWSAGHIDNSFRADSSGIHLQSPANVGDGASELTVSIWFKPDSKDDDDGVITSTGTDFNGIILSGYNSNNPAEFRCKSNRITTSDGNISAPIGKWTHAVGTWKSGQFQRLYINGELIVEDGTPPTGTLDVDHWRIGKDRNDNNRAFNGSVDDVGIWSRAMDAGEVRALYAQGLDAHDIDGSNDVVQLPYTPVDNGGTELTLSAWINPRSKANNDGLISAAGSSYHALLFKGTTGFPLESRSKSNSLAAATTAPNEQWTHVTSVWKSGQLQRLYIDGLQAANEASPPSGPLDITDWYLGRDRTDNNRIIDGILGEPVIVGRALSDTDVANLTTVGRANYDASHGFFARSGHIGSSSGDSHFAEGAGVFMISGVGSGIGGTADDFEFAARQNSGIYQFDARLEDFHGTGPGAEAGIMIRDSLDPGAKFVFLRASPDQTLTLERRHTTSSGTVVEISQPGIAPPGIFLRLVRTGSSFIASYSTDGTSYTQFASVTVDMIDNAHAGIALAPASTTTPGTAQFSRLAVTLPNPDSDDDDLADSWEIAHFGNLTTTDGLPGQDFDSDSLDDDDEYNLGSDPTMDDSDGDGLTDGDEVNTFATDLLDPDSDGDGFNDGTEVAWGSSPTNASDIPNVPGLIAYYPCDEGSGNTANDIVGGFDGVENQNTIGWTSNGLAGGALDLPGNASLLAADSIPPGTTALTISAWVNPDATGPYKGVFAGRQNPGNWGLNVEDTHVDYRFANTGGSSFGLDSPANSITAASGWHHLAITWETTGSSSTSTAYLDGVVIAGPSTLANLGYVAPTIGYHIGDDPCCNDREFDGQIDEIAVFDTALDPTQIASIHSEGLEGRSILEALLPSPDLEVTAIAFDPTTGETTITWDSSGGAASYTILTTTDLALPIDSWSVADPAVLNDGATTSYVHPASVPNDSTRFFVIREN